MTKSFDYGPLLTYEITWASGYIEKIQCHQVSYSDKGSVLDLIGEARGVETKTVRWAHFHGMFGDHWRLVLSAREDDLAAVRLVTGGEAFPGASWGGDADAS